MSDSQSDNVEPGRAAPTVTDGEDGTPVVLIAEDERPIAEALSDIIEEAGYRAVVASNGDCALELARMERPALVISDYMMPHMNGIRLIQALREEAQARDQPAPPVALMSAARLPYADGEMADTIIRKPFDIEEIEAILRRFIGEQR